MNSKKNFRSHTYIRYIKSCCVLLFSVFGAFLNGINTASAETFKGTCD